MNRLVRGDYGGVKETEVGRGIRIARRGGGPLLLPASTGIVECVPPQTDGSRYLAAARNLEPLTFHVGNESYTVVPRLVAELPEKVEPGSGRPYNILGPRYQILGLSADEKTLLSVYVKCDFVKGELFADGRRVLDFGEPFSSVRDPSIRGSDNANLDESWAQPPSRRPWMNNTHSITMTLAIYNDNNDPIDPVNVIFYDALGDTIYHMMRVSGWSTTTCNDPHSAWFFDGEHGGEDHWELNQRVWEKPETPWWAFCIHGDRYHAREFISEAWAGDYHDPAPAGQGLFQGYAQFPVHQDDPTRPGVGNVELDEDIRGSHHVVDRYIVRVPGVTGDECGACDGRFFGTVYFYEVSGDDPANPDDGNNPGGTAKNCDQITGTKLLDSSQEFWLLQFTCVKDRGTIEFP